LELLDVIAELGKRCVEGTRDTASGKFVSLAHIDDSRRRCEESV
jgi:hypothetical protein